MEQIYEIAAALAAAAAALVCVAKACKWPWGEKAFDKAAAFLKAALKYIPKKRLVDDEEGEEDER